MAQRAIREYDAKRMFANFSSSEYRGYLIESEGDIDAFGQKETATISGSPPYRGSERGYSEDIPPSLLLRSNSSPKSGELETYKGRNNQTFVIKPDQLFGKRGKYGLLGVNLDIAHIRKWWSEHNQKKTTIGRQEGLLTTFLIEPFVSHTSEYYVAIKTERDHDVIYFSTAGGIEVEENWESVQEMRIPLGLRHPEPVKDPSNQEYGFFVPQNDDILEIAVIFHIADPRISTFIVSLYSFFREYGFAYLEVNPFTFALDGSIVCLDMVARVDDSEEFRQRRNWDGLIFPHPFGPEKTD
jgi:succinyl-CoA synthetase beta subunit